MMELAHFYGWTLAYIESLPMYKIAIAREYIDHVNKSQGGEQQNGRR